MATEKQRAIKSVSEFKRLASRKRGIAYHILLRFGIRSSKWAQFIQSSKRYVVDSFVDNSHVILTEKNFLKSISAQAIAVGALILEG